MPQDKEYLLKEQTAEATYQKKLTAGQNIVISPDNVISALGSTTPPTSVTVTPKTLSGENIADMTVNGTTYHLYSSYPRTMTGATTASAGQSGYVPTPYSTDKDYVLYGSGEWKDPHVPVITANPAGSTTTALNKLYLDGTIYGIAGGGGSGTEVIPNPMGVATEELTKLEIDGTIYSISGGGVPIEEEDIDPNDFVNNYQSSMNISVDSTTNKLTYQWNSGIQIGTCSVLNYPIDLSVYTGAKVKITTGATAYSTTEFYGINIGVRSGYSTNYIGTTSTGWILQETFYNLNSTITYAFDFSTLTGMDNYFYICGGGWNFVVDEIVFYKKGESTKVIPNPSDQPTDTLESIGIDGTVYELPGANKSIPLFKEGQWLNQDIIEITPYLATIENNKLHCQGLHCGIVVSNIISLSNAVYYSITIKVSSTNGFGFQIGQCVPTTNLDGIIGSGTDRITYNNESSFDSGELTITTNNNTNGIFLGGYYQDINTDYYIEEISLLKITVVKKEYT